MTSNTWGVIGFVVALLVSIMLHEFGHFVTAKAFGMKVTQFFLGFGPTLWSVRRGETEYGIKAIPAGGFVRIIGMTPLEEVAPEDRDRVMWRQPAGRKAIVMGAGSAMHFLIGLTILIIVVLTMGKATIGTTVGQVAPCVADQCTPSSPPSPARLAGVAAGDRIVAIDGINVATWADITREIRAHKAGDRVELVVIRKGAVTVLHSGIASVERQSLTDPKKTVKVGAIGIVVREERRPIAVSSAIGLTFTNFWQITTGTLSRLVAVPKQIPALFNTDKPRNTDGLISAVGAARLGGEAVARGGLSYFFLLVASLNISIGVFNLLPLLPLDGGHLAIIWFEKVRSWIARRLRRPDPGRLDLLKLLPAAYAVIALFAGLSLLLVVNDVVNPIVNPF